MTNRRHSSQHRSGRQHTATNRARRTEAEPPASSAVAAKRAEILNRGIRNDWTNAKLAEELQVSQRHASTLRRRFAECGDAGLQPRTKGRPPLLHPEHELRARDLILAAAQDSGSGVPTARQIADLLLRKFGVDYTEDGARKLLKRLGLSRWQSLVRE